MENIVRNLNTYRLIDRKHQVRNNARGTEQNDFETPHCSFERVWPDSAGDKY